MSPTTMLTRAVSAMLLLFACAGALAQDAAPAGLAVASAKALILNDAQFVGQSVPASMTPGGVYNVAVTMKNTGSATWPAGGGYMLGSQNPQDNARWGGARAALGAAVPPGGQGTFGFQVTAPATPGTYGFQWRMVQEFVAWFGPLTPNVAVTVGGATPRNDAQVTAQSAPAQMTAGKSYNVSVTLKNTGTTTWKSADAYMLGAQNPQDNRLWNSGRVALGATVAPGQQVTFNFPVVAPAPGSYGMQWRMLREGAEWFGGTSSAPVTVAGAAGGDIVTYIHTDALGSPVARSDAAGNIISRTRYEPYGGTAGGVTPMIGFTGHVNDADTGLVYMQQRYYDPVAGRFLSVDPLTTDANTGGSFNRYAYADNSPYKFVDPDGRNPLAIAVVTGGAVLLIGAYKYATDPQARAVFNRMVAAIASSSNGNGSKDTLAPGEHADKSVPARGPDRDFSKGERSEINDIGGVSGCHTCGTKDPGTSSGNFIPDHQPPNSLNPTGGAQELYPHCLTCSRTQGGQVRGDQVRKPKPPEPKKPEKVPTKD